MNVYERFHEFCIHRMNVYGLLYSSDECTRQMNMPSTNPYRTATSLFIKLPFLSPA